MHIRRGYRRCRCLCELPMLSFYSPLSSILIRSSSVICCTSSQPLAQPTVTHLQTINKPLNNLWGIYYVQATKHASEGIHTGFEGPFTRCDFFWVQLRFYTSHGMGCMDVNDTVHTVKLQFDLKMLSHSEKIAPCERALKPRANVTRSPK